MAFILYSMRENSCTEFKSSFSAAVIETLTAFANSKGGKVLIGMDDLGKPVRGFTLGNETLQKWVNEVKNKTQPSIMAFKSSLRNYRYDYAADGDHGIPRYSFKGIDLE
jgi:predicted HTH transcriptional regulator